MKEYIPKKPEECRLDKSLYLRVLKTVQDYPRMKQKSLNELFYTSHYTEKPQKYDIGDQTYKKAQAREKVLSDLKAIDKAQKRIPIEYRKYIFNNVVYSVRCPDFANKNTWSKWRLMFLFYVAEELNLI